MGKRGVGVGGGVEGVAQGLPRMQHGLTQRYSLQDTSQEDGTEGSTAYNRDRPEGTDILGDAGEQQGGGDAGALREQGVAVGGGGFTGGLAGGGDDERGDGAEAAEVFWRQEAVGEAPAALGGGGGIMSGVAEVDGGVGLRESGGHLLHGGALGGEEADFGPVQLGVEPLEDGFPVFLGEGEVAGRVGDDEYATASHTVCTGCCIEEDDAAEGARGAEEIGSVVEHFPGEADEAGLEDEGERDAGEGGEGLGDRGGGGGGR